MENVIPILRLVSLFGLPISYGLMKNSFYDGLFMFFIIITIVGWFGEMNER